MPLIKWMWFDLAGVFLFGDEQVKCMCDITSIVYQMMALYKIIEHDIS